MKLKRIKLVGAGVLAVAVAIVALQNRADIDTKILFVTVTMPRAILIFLMALVGFCGGVLTTLIVQAKRKSGRVASSRVNENETKKETAA